MNTLNRRGLRSTHFVTFLAFLPVHLYNIIQLDCRKKKKKNTVGGLNPITPPLRPDKFMLWGVTVK